MTKKDCPLGEDCDLTIAWMSGAEDARDRAKARIAALEAKLAKAVEALDRIAGKAPYADDPYDIARAALKELNGDKT
jgi:outer membrane protein TolC